MKLHDLDWGDEITHNHENLGKVKTLLDSVGPGFCLAKWNQVTLHLGTGMTHSCHHPSPHKIPLVEIQQDPSALHNTSYKKNQRKLMLKGERPTECDYCWRIEDKGEFSDRQSKSLEPWALPYYDTISEMNGDENVYPAYLEVSFSNACNLKCVYCGPEFSSKWVEELKQQGPIRLLEDTEFKQWAQGWQNLDELTIKNREENPYIDAFWNWFPDAYKHLKVYRITGGEPLMSKETFRSLDFFLENPNPELELAINTNLSVPDKLWDRFIEKAVQLTSERKVKKFTVFTSVEGWGKRAEYARHGLDFELFKKRYEQLISLGNIRTVIMATYNILSVTSFQQLLDWHLALKIKYNPNNTLQAVEDSTGFKLIDNDSLTERRNKSPDHAVIAGIDIPYLRSPSFLDAQYATHDLLETYMLPTMDFLARNMASTIWNDHIGFENYEVEKFKRVVVHRLYFNRKNQLDREEGQDILMNRAKFYDFITQNDQRRNLNFVETFPEMADYFELCRISKEKLTNK